MHTRFKSLAAATILLGSMAFALPSAVSADDDDLGAYLYEASCDDLNSDAIIDDLGDLEVDDDTDSEWARISNGQEAPAQLWAEDEDLGKITLDDLLDAPHAIAIHASDSKTADVIACGDITGTPENDTLLIELTEVEASGFEGRAQFAPDSDDPELEVTIGVWAAGEVEPLGTPASPAA